MGATMADATQQTQEVDVAIMAAQLMEGDEALPNSYGACARGLIAQEKKLSPVYTVANRHEFFETLRKIGAQSKRIRRLVIVAHGNTSHCLVLDNSGHPSARLTKRDLNLEYVRRRLDEKATEAQELQDELDGATKELAKPHDDSERDALVQQINGVQGDLEAARREVEVLNQKQGDILSVADVMAPGAQIAMLNCFAGGEDDAGDPDEAESESEYVAAQTSFLRSMGLCLLGKNGGVAMGPRGWFLSAFLGEDTDWGKLEWAEYIAALIVAVQEGLGGEQTGRYIGWNFGGRVDAQIAPQSKPYLIGRALIQGEVDIRPSSAAIADVATLLMTGGGSFIAAAWGPESDMSTIKLPESVFCGRAEVPCAGRLRYRIRVQPPSPGGMTELNTNATLDLRLIAASGGQVCVRGSGAWMGEEARADFAVPAPCSVEATLNPPKSEGVFAGRNPAQSATFELEFVSGGSVSSGAILRQGDRIKTGPGAFALVAFTDGFRCLVRRDSSVKFNQTTDGRLRIEVERGGVHLLDSENGGTPYDLRIGDAVFTPKGTTLDVAHTTDDNVLRVLAGAVSTPGARGDEIVSAGSQILLDTMEVVRVKDFYPGDATFGGWPVGDFPLETGAVPLGASENALRSGALPEGWRWLATPPVHDEDEETDPAQKESEDALAVNSAGVLHVSTRPNASDDRDQTGAAEPALATRLSGDFDVAAQIDLTTASADSAFVRCFVFAPGSNSGFDWSRGDDYRGWADDRLDLPGVLRRVPGRLDFAAGVDAPPTAPMNGPVWLRLRRRGTHIETSASVDGATWLSVGACDRQNLPETVWVGLSFTHAVGDYDARPNRGATINILGLRVASHALGAAPTR